jgi:hypothetical protein
MANTQQATQGVDKVQQGGNNTYPATTFTSNQTVKAAPGILCSVLITTTTATAAIEIFDNATTNSGTIIGYIPSGATAGTVFVFNMPAANGITIGTSTGTGAFTVSYI